MNKISKIQQSSVRNIKDSQNFLYDDKLVSKLVNMSNLSNNDLVLEIGPGKGIITDALKGRYKKLIAIEIDKQLYTNLQSGYLKDSAIVLLNQDFLAYDLPCEPYKVFSNIPFNLTGDILTKLLTSPNPPDDVYLVMQYEAVLKYGGEPFCADSLKSLMFKPSFTVEILHKFVQTDFVPKPNVAIVFVHFHKKEYCDIKKAPIIEWWDFLSFIYCSSGTTFKEKTKKIFSYEQQKRLKKLYGISEEATISEWTYKQWLGLFDCFIKMVCVEKRLLVKDSYKHLLSEQAHLEKLHRSRKE